MSYTLHVSMPDMSAILCGATTNNPGASERRSEALQQSGRRLQAGRRPGRVPP